MIERTAEGPTNLRSIRSVGDFRVLLSERISPWWDSPMPLGESPRCRGHRSGRLSRSPQAVGPSGVLTSSPRPGFVGSCPTSQCRRSARRCGRAVPLARLKPRGLPASSPRGGRRLLEGGPESAQAAGSGDRPPLPGGQARRRDRNRTRLLENTVKVHLHKGRDRLARRLDERWRSPDESR